ncbi:hypothetical protein L218DRAFT_955112 [Marasmius fiardii PR-910]|nr:hypothetical protein L218DRAFT_955112 [Marasmius fiardii PR-910]
MGNCFSAQDPVSLVDLINRPDDLSEVRMTAAMIHEGLASVANTLNRRRRNVAIVAVGGAVNTLLLQTRTTTGDVDFFYKTKERNEDVSKIILAADTAATELGLGDHWLNNHTAVFVQVGVIQQLYDEAVHQHEIVFQEPGLTVYAAPWRYALGTKLDRLSKRGAKLYDMNDAVDYLERLIEKRDGRAVEKSELLEWAVEFRFTPPSDDLMDELGTKYEEKTGYYGIIDG